jgi:DnaJ family protein C protein 7
MTNGDATQLKNEANELYSKRQYSKAIDIYSQAIELSSEMSVLYSNRALCYINLAQYKTALSDCLKSISIDNNFKAYFRASTCQLHLGNLEDAKNMVVAGHKIKDNEQFRTQSDQLELIDSKLVLYHLKFKHKEYRKALDHIEELFCLLDPSLIGTGLPDSISNLDTSMMFRIPIKWKLWRAECLIGLNDCHEAGQIAMALLRTTEESKNSEAIYIRAKTMYLLDSHPIATVVQFLSTSLSYDPDNKNARLLFKHVKKLEKLKEAGNEYFKAGDWQNAIDTYTEFINNDPEGGAVLAKIYSNRAIVYNRLEQYEKVEEDCNSGLKIIESMGFPNATHSGEDISNEDRQQSLFQKTFSKLYLRRADCFTKQEKFQEAVHEYETCCVLDPENRGNIF